MKVCDYDVKEEVYNVHTCAFTVGGGEGRGGGQEQIAYLG